MKETADDSKEVEAKDDSQRRRRLKKRTLKRMSRRQTRVSMKRWRSRRSS